MKKSVIVSLMLLGAIGCHNDGQLTEASTEDATLSARSGSAQPDVPLDCFDDKDCGYPKVDGISEVYCKTLWDIGPGGHYLFCDSRRKATPPNQHKNCKCVKDKCTGPSIPTSLTGECMMDGDKCVCDDEGGTCGPEELGEAVCQNIKKAGPGSS